jgi:hypothetical protein
LILKGLVARVVHAPSQREGQERVHLPKKDLRSDLDAWPPGEDGGCADRSEKICTHVFIGLDSEDVQVLKDDTISLSYIIDFYK